MARISADGQEYTQGLALGALSALSLCVWFKLSVDRNDYSTIFFVDAGTGDNWGMQTGADGTTMSTVFDASTQQGMGALTVDTWYFACLATSGTTGTLYHKTAGASSLTAVAVTAASGVTATTLRLGDSPWGAEWWNGGINAVKTYSVQLTAAEAHQESMQYAPVRTANLLGFYPLVRPETTDYSGNARTLSGGSGATREDGPPIPWQATRARIILPVSVAGGSTHNADAAVAGSGGVTAAGSSTKPAAGLLSGAGLVTSAGTTTKPAAVALAGTGTFTAAATVGAAPLSAAAVPTATGSIIVNGATSKPASATLNVTGSATVAGAVDKPGSAAITGTAAITPSAAVTKPVGGTLLGAGNLAGTGTTTKPMQATVTATGTVTAGAVVGVAPVTAQAALIGTAAATATTERSQPATATQSAVGAWTASAVVVKPIAASLTGTVTCTVDGSKTVPSGAALTGVATMTVSAVAQGQITRGGSGLLDRTTSAATPLERRAPTARGVT